jgi:hypothetical protein
MRKIISALLLVLLSFLLIGADGDYCPRFRPEIVSIKNTSSEHRSEVIEAVKGWNKALGYNYFQLGDYTYTLSIFTHEIPKEYGALGVYFDSTIVLDISVPDYVVRIVAFHELGHAIGLPHHTDPFSIMFPSIDGMRVFSPQKVDVILANYYIEQNITGKVRAAPRN